MYQDILIVREHFVFCLRSRQNWLVGAVTERTVDNSIYPNLDCMSRRHDSLQDERNPGNPVCKLSAGELAQPWRAYAKGQFPWWPWWRWRALRRANRAGRRVLGFARGVKIAVGAAAFATIFTGLRVRQRGCERIRFVRKHRVVSHQRVLWFLFVLLACLSACLACLPACLPYLSARWVGSDPSFKSIRYDIEEK